MRIRSAGGVVFLFVLASIATFAQVISTSQIRGAITDPSGTAVAGAEIKVTQTATGLVRTATSAADGTYSMPDLPVGRYRMEVTKEGFNKYIATNLILTVGVSPTLNVALQVGAVTQEVQVSAESVMVETQSEGVGTVTPPEAVQELPLNGRQVTDLLPLAGAVGQGRAFRASYPSSAVISIAGGAQGSVAYWLDGGTHNDPLSNQNLPLPFPDTIEEFKVETSSLPAQYGTHPSGAVNVVTKSGGNAFHGDAFEYVRNYMFDSRNTAFANASPADYPFLPQAQAEAAAVAASPRDDLKRNQFGGTVGGPIKKDKAFFFLGWQDTIQRATIPAQTSIPTQAMLQGDFQACVGNGSGTPGNKVVLGAPFGSGTAADGVSGPNATNPANYSPVILAFESHMPVAPASSPCGVYSYKRPQSFTENQGLARVDVHTSNRNSFFARYFITNWNQPPGKNDPNNLLIASIDGALDRVQNLTLGDTYLIGSNLVNSVHATGNRSRNLTVQNNTLDLNGLFAAAGITSGINVYQLGPQVGKFFPHFMAGFNPTGGFSGYTASTPSIQPYDTLEFSDDVIWTRGAHQISFGVDFINLRAFAHNYLFNQGSYTFSGAQTGCSPQAGCFSGGLTDFLVGETSASGGFSQDAPIPSLQHQNIFALYVQDAWKATRKLTVTAGLRWDPFFGHTVPGGVDVVNVSLANIINNVHSTKFPTAPAGYLFPGDPGMPSGNKLTPNALNKWSPRIGLAWDPRGDGRMAVRAGFGIFYDFPNFSYDQFGFEEPWGGAVTVPGAKCASFPCNSDLTDPWGAAGFTFIDQQGIVHTGQNPFPTYVGQGPAKSAYLPGSLVFSYPANTIKPTYVMQYNLSVEKQVGTNWLLSISYIGSQQRHLWGNNEVNPGLQGPCPGAYPNGYPLPAGVNCTAPGGGGKTISGACPPFLPPFVCGGPASLSNNRLFYHFNGGNPVFLGSLCGSPAAQNASCYGETLFLEEGGTGNYNGMLLSAQHRFGNHFTSTTNYTWSHCISDNYTTTLGFFLAAESVPYDRKADRGNCPNADTHNIFNESLVAESPNFSGHLTQLLLGNWGFSLSMIVQSGTDLSPINILDFSGSGNGLTQRPNLTPGANPYCQKKSRTCFLNKSSFSFPAPYTFGNLKNMSIFGPGSIGVNTGLWKSFKITESQQIQFKWEVFNLPNHANLYPPQTAFVAPTFGQPSPGSTAGLGALNQTANDPRTMQFSLKYSF
ncbi:MAG: carboxypeptidase regulatory-like domain-containing protein [Acidobacteriota bacterium]|nr:carboxypeptidase regulatory-like domain-containing protein [Acidobacteriota bacterium]